MQLIPLTLVCAGIFAVLRFGLMDYFGRIFNSRRLATKIGKASSLAALRTLRDFSLIGFIAYFAVWLFVLASSLRGGLDPQTFASAISWLEGLMQPLKALAGLWSRALFGAVLFGLAYLYYRRQRRSITSALRQGLEEAVRVASEQIEKEQEGKKPPLAPNLEMLEIQRRIDQADELLGRTASESDRQKLFTYRAALVQEYALADIERRATISFPADPDWRAGSSWIDKVRRVLFSTGLFRDLKGVPKALGYACNTLLLLSLIGFNAVTVENGIASRILRLSELQVTATKADLKREVREAKQQAEAAPNQPPSNQSLRPEDQQAINTLAAHFERAFADSRTWDIPVSADAAQRADVRQNLVREAILQEASGAYAGPASDVRPEEAVRTEEPATKTGARFREDLRSWYSRANRAVRDVVNANVKSYSEPLATMDAEKWAFGQAFGMAYDGASGGREDFVTQFSSQIAKNFGREGVQTTYQIFADQALSGIFGRDDLATVFRDLKRGKKGRAYTTAADAAFVKAQSSHGPTTADLHSKFAESPPSAASKSEVSPEAVAKIRDLDRDSGPSVADAAISYNDIAPADANAALESERGRLLQGLAGSGSGGVPLSPPSLPGGGGVSAGELVSRARAQFSVGRSFSGLRGSFRVGGVLIGQEPKGPPLNFRDINWHDSGSRVGISLTRSDGRVFELGNFRKSSVNQALAYAADGRPLMVTMASAYPLLELKILVHPALVDTPLGCRMIEMDRFVDEFTGGNPLREAESKRIEAEAAAYELAWYARQSKYALGDASLAEQRIEEPGLRRQVQAALSSGDSFADPKKSLLAAKREFFDSNLVLAMAQCQKPSKGSADDFRHCLEQAGPAELTESQKRKWSSEPPAFELWSGVRELEYQLDPDLNFLKPPANSPLWPFDFLMQVAFTSDPKFLADGDAASYADRDPFEFPALKPAIQQSVSAALGSHSAEREYLAENRDFATLQRLFRTALQGRLGSGFPLEKLVSLAKLTQGSVPKAHTPRWNYRPRVLETRFAGQLELVSVLLKGEQDDLLRTARSQSNVCLAAVKANAASVADIPAAEWNSECGFSALKVQAEGQCVGDNELDPACLVKEIAQLASTTAKARELRFALGVPQDEALKRKTRGCPPM
jgi:hypothetical protein